MNDKNEKWMLMALEEARQAYLEDEVPIGCVIVKDNELIAKAHNQKEALNDATAHAEMLAIKQASKALDSCYLDGCEMYVTIEPCAMCAGAIMLSRIKKVYYGSKNEKFGCLDSVIQMYTHTQFNHLPEQSSGILKESIEQLMKAYFAKKRRN